jgi:hypothetical protein
MKEVELLRYHMSEKVTLGLIKWDDELFFSLELPWRDNEKEKSCIPPGDYVCVDYSSPKYPQAFLVRGVPGREDILIHPGNQVQDTKGCILPGTLCDVNTPISHVLQSRVAMERLKGLSKFKPFLLKIREEI